MFFFRKMVSLLMIVSKILIWAVNGHGYFLFEMYSSVKFDFELVIHIDPFFFKEMAMNLMPHPKCTAVGASPYLKHVNCKINMT